MLKTLEKVANTAVVVKSVLSSTEFNTALDIASKKLRAIRKTEKEEQEELYRFVSKRKALMEKYYTHQRKIVCRAFFAQLKAIYKSKEQEQSLQANKTITTVN